VTREVATRGQLHVRPNLAVRPAYDGSGGYQLSWGEGSRREQFLTESPELAACLATLPSPTTAEFVVARLVADLGMDEPTSINLVADLSDYGFWSSSAPTTWTDGEQSWLDVEWNDALEFHAATRNMIWSHDYSGDPKVMTRYHVEHNVVPDTEPPTRYRPEVTATIPLPEPAMPDIEFHQLARQRRTSRDFRRSSHAHRPRHDPVLDVQAPVPVGAAPLLRHTVIQPRHSVHRIRHHRGPRGSGRTRTGLRRLPLLT
jgi:hypothetical protein